MEGGRAVLSRMMELWDLEQETWPIMVPKLPVFIPFYNTVCLHPAPGTRKISKILFFFFFYCDCPGLLGFYLLSFPIFFPFVFFFGNAWARQEFKSLDHWIIAFILDKTPTLCAPCNLPVPFPPQFPQTDGDKVSSVQNTGKIAPKFKSPPPQFSFSRGEKSSFFWGYFPYYKGKLVHWKWFCMVEGASCTLEISGKKRVQRGYNIKNLFLFPFHRAITDRGSKHLAQIAFWWLQLVRKYCLHPRGNIIF